LFLKVIYQSDDLRAMRKTVLITGASSGIGKITAIYFHEMGWNVAATMRTVINEKELLEFENIKCFQIDVCEEPSIQSTVTAAIQHFGGIDVIVNNAGFATVGPFEAASQEDIRRSFETNLYGAMNVTRAILPYFRERKGGVIINVSSRDGRIGLPLHSIYSAAKWALEGFSESLQFELRQFGIRVKLIEPGPVNSDFYGRSQQVIHSSKLSAYDDYVNLTMPNLQQAGADGDGAELVAAKIYQAATDSSWRIRYPAGNGTPFLLWLRGKIPTHWFMRIIRSKMEVKKDRLSKYKKAE